MLMKVSIPTAAGNDAIAGGKLSEVVKSSLEALNAEAAYFTAENGMRTALIFFEMDDATDIPSASEPFFMALQAEIELSPVMNVQEMQAGVGKAMARL